MPTTRYKRIVARVEHRCYLCGEIIMPKEKYAKVSGIDDGEWWLTHLHLECDDATKDWDIMDWDGFQEGSFERPLKKLCFTN